ncbi:probable transmembrane ascorbate ferrireductase 3 [Magnolia sinica]|uniref:probable transmembrane ascorbate ferrireductase 3 n=1 Tax=Magnolia sinica TaxID=86752 RepID=UPI002659F9C4|nr:probable transmembrane ascorbate ferrireductase 3 [Magnolia sinica]
MALIQTTRIRVGSPATAVAAHLFGVIAVILMLVWVFHYRGGIDLDSQDSERVFNVHPFLMIFGFIFVIGEALIAYKTIPADHVGQKTCHSILNLIAFIIGVIGIYAVFKYHDRAQISDMYTLHSWLGITTICLFGLQWVFGFLSFWLPVTRGSARARIAPWHASFGVCIFVMAICTAEMGLAEKFIFSGLTGGNQANVINATGYMIFLFAVSVILTVV